MWKETFIAGVLIGTIASCGGVASVRSTSLVAAPSARSALPADVAAFRLLAGGEPLVALARGPSLDVHAEPGTERPYMDLQATNPWGQSLRLLVVGRGLDDDGEVWLRVQLPIWPNGQTGWVEASDVVLGPTSERVVVDLSERRLIHVREDGPVTRMPVAVGAAATPTPPGRYFVWATVETGRPSGPYGSFILGLSGFSEAIEPWKEWPGEPRLAIHGTDDPAEAGDAISKGCVRVQNALLRHLRDVPMGTPVVIRP